MTAARSAAALALVAVLTAGCHRGGGGGQEAADAFIPDAVGGGGDVVVPEAGLGVGRVDRDGHPLVTLLLVPGSLTDEYNAHSSFEPNVPRVLQDALEARLVALDTLALGDGGPDEVDWVIPDGGSHPLLPIFVSDVLLIDTGRSCVTADGGFASSYLDIEREIELDGAPHTTCGGRTPADDVVDETMTLLVTRNRVPVTQAVDAAPPPSSTTFPYLAPPN